jgi:hypothetical protein
MTHHAQRFISRRYHVMRPEEFINDQNIKITKAGRLPVVSVVVHSARALWFG